MPKDFKEQLLPGKFQSSGVPNNAFGVAHAYRFIVQMDLKGLTELTNPEKDKEFWVNISEASVPGMNMTVEGSIINQRQRYHATERADQDLQLTFVESSDMPMRKLFCDWMSLIWNPDTLSRAYPSTYSLDEITVWSFDKALQAHTGDVFKKCFPFNINDLDYKVDTYDVVSTQVQFKYSAHTVITAGEPNLTWTNL
jgi:hypothetical protein